MTDPVVLLSTGDVIGPNSSTDGTMVLFDGTTGKKVKGNNAVVTAQGLALLDDVDAASNRATIGLDQLNNTSDLNKPVSNAQAAADNLRLLISSKATQPDAELGTSDSLWMSPLMVFKAIAKVVVQATETAFGWAKVATQTQTNMGTDDATIVTPKKLLFGFSALVALNGYVTFPICLGGLIIQWGTAASVGTGGVVVTFPMAFPNNIFIQMVTVSTPTGPVSQYANVVPTETPKSSFIIALNTGVQAVGWFALGK